MRRPSVTEPSCRAARRPGRAWPIAAVLLALLPTPRAVGQLVPADQCNPRPCQCADMPVLDRFILATEAAENAWTIVFASFSTDNPPGTLDDTRALFNANNPVDPVLLAEGQKGCPTFNGGKIGGVDASGNTLYDKCYCQAFCDIMVLSTGDHEKRHHDNMVSLAVTQIFVVAGEALLGESVPYNPSVLTLSELDAHQAQLKSLESRRADFLAKNTACTWTPIVDPPPTKAGATGGGFATRLRALYQRITGASSR